MELRLRDGNNQYWDGGSLVGSANTWVVATGSSATNSVVNWTYTSLPAWVAQTYTLNVRALDEAGNYTITYSTITFTYDNTPPVTITTYPVSGTTYRFMTRFYGTAVDGLAPRDIAEIRVKIYRLNAGTTEHWDGGSAAWEVPPVWNLVSNSANQGGSAYNWDYASPNFTAAPLTWTSGMTYYIESRAIDTAGNIGIEEFHEDVRVRHPMPPASSPTLPQDDQAYRSSDLTVLSGTAVDATSPLASVKLSILDQDASGGPKYFNGSTFTASTEQLINVSHLFTSSWTYSSGAFEFPRRSPLHRQILRVGHNRKHRADGNRQSFSSRQYDPALRRDGAAQRCYGRDG